VIAFFFGFLPSYISPPTVSRCRRLRFFLVSLFISAFLQLTLSCFFFFLWVLACRRRRRAPPGGVAARCRTVTRPAGVILPASHGVPPEAARPARWGGCPVPDGDPGRRGYSSYESWRAAGGGAPRPVGWLPGAGRWPALPPAGARAASGFSFPYRPLPDRVRRRVRPLVGGGAPSLDTN